MSAFFFLVPATVYNIHRIERNYIFEIVQCISKVIFEIVTCIQQNRNSQGCGFFEWLDPPTSQSSQVQDGIDVHVQGLANDVKITDITDNMMMLIASESLKIKILLCVIVVLLCMILIK